MQVSLNSNNATPGFGGHIIINVADLPKALRKKAVLEFRKALGDGLKRKDYSCTSGRIKNFYFIGYVNDCFDKRFASRVSEIEISTGNNSKISPDKIDEKTNQVDSVLLETAKGIIEKLQINPKRRIWFDIRPESESGEIRIVNRNEIVTQAIDEKSGVVFKNCFKKKSGTGFEHTGTDIDVYIF